MKKLKTLSLFKIALLFVLNLYFKNIFLFVISLAYLFISYLYDGIFFIVLICIFYALNLVNCDIIPLGYVSEKKINYVVVDKLIYKVKTSSNYLEVGDIVCFNDASSKSEDSDLLNKNILYLNDEYNKLAFSLPYKEINKKANEDNLYKKILLNDYVDTNEFDYYLGYGFAFYYLLTKVFKKNKYLAICLIFVYTLLFGFEIKLLLIIIDFILSFFELESINKLSIKLIIIAFINIHLFNNYSFLISLLFSFLNLTEYHNNVLILGLLQSFFFGQVSILNCLLFEHYINIRIIIFIITFITFFLSFLYKPYLFVMKFFSFILKIMTFSIRGKISIITLLILLISNFFIKKYKQYLLYLILLICLISGVNNPLVHVSYIDVNQGDAILIKSKTNILIDTGSNYNYYKLKKELFNQGIYTIDYLIITHSDEDHSGNIEALKKDFKIKEIVGEGKDINSDINLQYLYVDTYDNENDNSLIYYLYLNKLSFLFTGDISKEVENRLINKYELGKINVLKVSHHGSNTGSSSYFISKILPDYAIISTNGNYGHPHKETIDTLNSYLVNILLTKDSGTITFYLSLINFIKTNDKIIIIAS